MFKTWSGLGKPNPSLVLPLIKERELQHLEFNKAILRQIPHVVEAVAEILSKQGIARVLWRDIQFVQDSNDIIIVLAAIVTPKIGSTTFLEDGSPIAVTAKNADHLSRSIRIGVPLDVILNGTKEQIVGFLTEHEKKKYEKASLKDTLVDLQTTEGKLPGEFDYKDLSEEQVKLLVIQENMSKGKLH